MFRRGESQRRSAAERDRTGLTEQGGDLWKGLTADDGLLGQMNPLLLSPLIMGQYQLPASLYFVAGERGHNSKPWAAMTISIYVTLFNNVQYV